MSLGKRIRNNFPTFKNKWFLAAIIFFVALTVYLITLAPTVSTEDSGELIAAAYTLGIPHPPGYPLWTMLGKLFTFLPISNIAWRVNFMSAFFASLTAALLFVFLLEIVKNQFIAFISSLIFAFSDVFWSQSVRAEVYTLNSFFVVLTLCLVIRWAKTKKRNFLYFFAFILGLSIANHQTMLFYIPAFAVFFIISQKNFWKEYKTILVMLLLFILGISFYLYLPIRSLANPAIDWGNPENLSNFVRHITRASYEEPIIDSLFAGNKILFIGNFFIQLMRQFNLVVIFGVFGLISLYLDERKKFFLLTLMFCLSFLVIIFFSKMSWLDTSTYGIRVFYIPSFLIYVLFISKGMDYLWEKFNLFMKKFSFFKKTAGFFLTIMFILLPLYFLSINFQNNNKSEDYLVYDYYSNLLNSLPQNSVLVSYEEGPQIDNNQFALAYLRIVEKIRPDVELRSLSLIYGNDPPPKQPSTEELRDFLPKYIEETKKEYSGPLYSTFSIDNIMKSKYISRSNGIAFQFLAGWEDWKKEPLATQFYFLRNLANKQDIPNDPFTWALVARYYYNSSHAWLDQGFLHKASEELQKALAYDLEAQGLAYRGFIVHRSNYLKEFKAEKR